MNGMTGLKFSIMLFSQLVVAQMPSGLMAEDRDEEGLAIGRVLAPMILNGPSADQYAKVAGLFAQDSRPVQALYFYRQATQLNPNDEGSKKGIQEVQDNLRYLERRFQDYKTKAKSGEKPAGFCSMAAIRFHQGYPSLALEILRDGHSVHGEQSGEINGLQATFLHGIHLETELLTRLETEFRDAAFEGDVEAAALLLGRMVSIGLGKERTVACLREFQALYPERVDPAVIESLSGLSFLLEMPPAQLASTDTDEKIKE